MNLPKHVYTMLDGWIKYSTDFLYTCPERPELICYGAGTGGWGVQTHQKCLAAFAVAATCQDATQVFSIPKDKLIEYSLKMLRFMLESHLEGSYRCMDGEKWGHTWISVLGIERVMHAIESLMEYMTNEDNMLLEKVMVSEADWIMDFHEICANQDASKGGNHPESNIWNGSFLHRVAMMYPHQKRCVQYKEKGTSYLVNGISVPDDASSKIMYDGKLVSELYIGNNFFATYSLDHHCYLNVGYMVICLSNIAMLHFSMKRYNVETPKALYHHAYELWQLVKTFLFDDGRLIRIGGDSRVRYCYCQDYVLPTLLFALDYWKDADCVELIDGLTQLFYKEFSHNKNGSFLSVRCESFKRLSPIYYTRLESDKAAVLSMLCEWADMVEDNGPNHEQIQRLASWHEEFHGACMEKGKRRFASWTWKGAQGAMGLCLPQGRSNLAEWEDNLFGTVKGMSYSNSEFQIVLHKEKLFNGGFATIGAVKRITDKFVAEQQKRETTVIQKTAFVALPDDATVVVMQYAHTINRTYIKEVYGTRLNIPNDVYNDSKRHYYCCDGKEIRVGGDRKDEAVYSCGDWINVDNELAVIKAYGMENLKIYSPGGRKTGIHNDNYREETGNLCCDILCGKLRLTPHWAAANEVILDEGMIVVSGLSAKQTCVAANEKTTVSISSKEKVRHVTLMGQDGEKYIVLANFSEERTTVTIQLNAGEKLINIANNSICDEDIQMTRMDILVIHMPSG